jgi:hypothetical protein
MNIPDPIERMQSRAEGYQSIWLGVCDQCGAKVDYDLYCLDPMGVGPNVCGDCLPPELEEAIDQVTTEG